MPGPNSNPEAKTRDGRIVKGKTALKRIGLKSRENMRKAKAETLKPQLNETTNLAWSE